MLKRQICAAYAVAADRIVFHADIKRDIDVETADLSVSLPCKTDAGGDIGLEPRMSFRNVLAADQNAAFFVSVQSIMI